MRGTRNAERALRREDRSPTAQREIDTWGFGEATAHIRHIWASHYAAMPPIAEQFLTESLL
jgi:hypothetical protein